MKRNDAVFPHHKIMEPSELPAIGAYAREQGLRVVTTNGSFDLLHAGHMQSLWWSCVFGDIMIVGINSDASVRAYKGNGRPIIPQNDRAYQVACVACVDYVCIFDEEEVGGALLRAVRPHVHTTGFNWEGHIPEWEVVNELGVNLQIVPAFVNEDGNNYSTSDIVRKIREMG